jgi:hypothetical protein
LAHHHLLPVPGIYDAALYRYDDRRIVTLGEFNPQSLISNLQSLVIFSAGSRDEHISYCSNVCCLTALEAIRFKRASRKQSDDPLPRSVFARRRNE